MEESFFEVLKLASAHPWWGAFWLGFIVVATIPEARGAIVQGQDVWRERSAQKLPLDAYAIDVGTFVATFCYGLTLGSWAYMFNGVVTGAALLYIFVGVFKFGTYTWLQKAHVAFVVVSTLTMIGTTAVFVGTDSSTAQWLVIALMSGFLVHTVVGELRKLRELSRGDGTGNVNIQENNTWLVTNMFFVFYAAGIRDPVFFVACVACVVIQSLMLWVYCRKARIALGSYVWAGVRSFPRAAWSEAGAVINFVRRRESAATEG